MSQRLYVGNLPYRTTEADLRRFLKKYEPIHSLILIADKETNQPRGYGFVELNELKADDALYDLRNAEFNGRNLRISMAMGKAPKDDTQKKEAPGKKSPMEKTSEKYNGTVAAERAALPQRNHRPTKTEYVVSDVNNYG